MIQGFEHGMRELGTRDDAATVFAKARICFDAAEAYKARALALIRLWEALATSNKATRDVCQKLGHIWHGDRCLGCEAIDTGGVTRGPIGSEKGQCSA